MPREDDDAEPTQFIPPDAAPEPATDPAGQASPPVDQAGQDEPGQAGQGGAGPAGEPGQAYPGYPGQAYPGYLPPGYGVPPGYPLPGYPLYDPYGRPLSDKSKVVAGVLGIVLGGLGVGRFYTGHVGLGVAQLLVSIFTCGFGHLWGLIDGILILTNGGTDAQGRVLRD